MSGPIKIFLLALLSIVAIGILAIWYTATSINPAHLTQLLSSSVKEATGRELKIAGPVSLKLLPTIAIAAEQVSLSNASWASQPDMLKVRHLELDIELLPLLKGEVSFNAINLNGLDAYLQTNQAGEGNWNFTLPTSSGAGANNVVGSIGNSLAADKIDPVRIRNITITDARLMYQKFGSTSKSILLPKLSLTGGINKNEIVGQIQYANYQVGIKGKTSNLREVLNDWDLRSVKVPLNFTLTVNDKAMVIDGEIDKEPHTQPSFNLSVHSKAFELAPLAGSAALAVTKGSAPTATKTKADEKYFFDNDILPFSALPEASGKLAIDIQELRFPGHLPITDLKGAFVFDGVRINIDNLAFGLGNGSAQAQASISGFKGSNPTISIKGMAKGFSLEQLMDMAGSSGKARGGDTKIAFNLHGSGTSLHQLASGANGVVQLSIDKASLNSSFIDGGGDLLMTIVNAVNPIQRRADQAVLECAVIYLPLNDGQVVLNDSIGVVTDRLDVVLSGSVDLKTEALNIKIDPREKSGLTTGVNLGGLVKLQGTLLNPRAGVNKEGVVNSAVSIGLGILTGGATILAENAKSLATKYATQPCKAALHSWSDIYPGMN
jgi:uncharacterized protein involved in outer membrane biogenesis